MSDCDRLQQVIERHWTGEAAAAELAALAEHCRSCPDCRALCALDEGLRAAAASVEPDAAGLAEVRRAVLREARREAGLGAERGRWALMDGRGWRRASGLLGSKALRYAAAAAFLTGLGYLAGLAGPAGLAGRTAGRAPLAEGGAIVRLLNSAASAAGADSGGGRRGEGREGGDPLDSPFIYSNVRFEPGQGERLHLGFDVSAHLELDRPADDPLVAEVVAQTLLAGTSPVGSRLKATAIASRLLSDPRARGALLRALRDDPSPAVRASALAGLGRERGDPAIRAAVLKALASEPSVAIRLLAIDVLAGGGIDRQTLEQAVDSAAGPMRAALEVRTAKDFHRDAPEGPGGLSGRNGKRSESNGSSRRIP
ncbi:MAG TPA: HEAT repeat domain-containing protein [Thermoanaerobaculia bacterium]|nr:HEAT repeat domain-containing protein [Thermoanaerobaculia bacterium]